MVNHEGVNPEIADKMLKAVELLESRLLGIQGAALTSGVIDTIKVSCYGQMMPIKHVAQTHDVVGKVMITPFDSSLLAELVKSLSSAGFNAYIFSKTSVAVSANPLDGEQRERVKEQVKKLAEDARISIRSIRKQARQKIDAALSKDDRVKAEKSIQDLTSQMEDKVDQIANFKLESLG